MRLVVAAVLFASLLSPVTAAPVTGTPAGPGRERAMMLALNPQPEPPGRAKIKRVYIKQDDSRRIKTLKPIKPQKPPVAAPAPKY
jgi:hypothetical protein